MIGIVKNKTCSWKQINLIIHNDGIAQLILYVMWKKNQFQFMIEESEYIDPPYHHGGMIEKHQQPD